MGETDVGGPVLNIVPRSGGNTFQGQAFTNFSNDALRGNNLTPELTAPTPGPNLRETPGIIKAYDANISYGGPIVRDRLWFFGSYRKLNTETAVEGVVGNANAFDLSRWDWVEDRSLTARSSAGRSIYIGRLTAQVAAKHRVSVNWECPAAMRRDTAQSRDRRLSHPRHELGCRDSDVVARGIPQLPRRPVYRRAGPLDEPDDEQAAAGSRRHLLLVSPRRRFPVPSPRRHFRHRRHGSVHRNQPGDRQRSTHRARTTCTARSPSTGTTPPARTTGTRRCRM